MLEGVRELEPKLKEVLYRFLEDVQTTKAALYLTDDRDSFELVTEYGFRGNLTARYASSDDLIDRLITKRAAFFLNGLTADPRFSEMLYNADTSRLLVAPIYSRGKLIGLVDLRDKAKQAPFEQVDLSKVQTIVEEFLELFSQNNLFGQRAIAEQVSRPVVARIEREGQSPAVRVIEEATAVVARGALRKAPQAQVVSESALNAASLVLPAIIGLPGVVIASVSPISRLGGTQIVAARGEVSAAAMEQLDSKVRTWMKKRGEAAPVAARTNMVYPYGTAGQTIDVNRLHTVLSAPVRTGTFDGIALSVAFEMNPDGATKAHLERFLNSAQQLASLAMSHDSLKRTRHQVAEKLLEPDFHKHPALVTHSMRVADLAEQLAQYVNLPDDEVEKVRIAAIVHDVGMRFLDYRNLYRKTHPTSEELKILRAHPVVGAAIIAESPLGPEIASLVMSHHERPDGTGYPDGLSGEQIPIGSRIIHLCEAYDAMTSTDSYQAPVAPAAAIAKIRRSAGTQFDAELSTKFAEMLAV